MSGKTIRFAFYGKGGIGKSTIVSNLTCLVAQKGLKVLHIGCDPKADSCILLTQKRIPTVLERLSAGTVKREDILFRGVLPGIFCIEAGGPQAGIGCAGMGISAMTEVLEQLDILSDDWDIIVYDVLGDVVCGGFAVPMRDHYIDKVFIVTSSDYMSLYAANNMIHAVQYYSGAESLLGGLIWNHRASESDREIAGSFLSFTGTKLLGMVDEEPGIRTADFRRELFALDHPDAPASQELRQIAENLIRLKENPSSPVFLNEPKERTQTELENWRMQICGGMIK